MPTKSDPELYKCSWHTYVQAFSSYHDQSRVNDNVTLSENEVKNSPRSRRHGEIAERSVDINIKADSKMVTEQISESVAVIQLPNYQEKRVESFVNFVSMKRFNEGVLFEPILAPFLYAETFICYKHSTRKRYVSTTFYEPRVKPKAFSETTVVFPKRPEKTFVSFLNYHIDECRRWFKTCIEFKAKTYTTSKMDVANDVNGYDKNGITDEPGVSQVFLPRFNTDDKFNAGSHKYRHIPSSEPLMNGDFNGF